MIYVKLEKLQRYYRATLVHYRPFDDRYGLKKTELELLKEGVLVDGLPERPELQDGKTLELRATLVQKELYYELVDIFIQE